MSMVGGESDKRESFDGSVRSKSGDDSSRRALETPVCIYFRAMVLLIKESLIRYRSNDKAVFHRCLRCCVKAVFEAAIVLVLKQTVWQKVCCMFWRNKFQQSPYYL